ncbi:cytochrome aa3 quinol oxidase subunit IV [Bacillus sp. BGMRC 2118]|nr:cytochrome aa3 quinol oxidase subunit IV [Bacillus sp. BGMRC 2118]
MEKHEKGFPISHVFGFILSLVLTFVAAAVVIKMNLSATITMWIIGSLAIIQAGLQLFMFMHVSEGEDKKTQIINLVYGVFCAIVIVVGTIWVMGFGNHMH